ncbi:hypothetical protein P4a_00022 [Klebsiella phage VLCpiP4a]|nr:hypothetical protein P4a_00022 [Klebsiella phage VLCpiP4a]UVX31109.1 hypothetical protein P4b_00014 [Klebsiella phage VLCpiP4b]
MSINDKPTTDNVQGNDSVDELQVDEMTILKQRATMMGIKFSNNIGLEALRKKVADAQEGITEQEQPEVNPLATTTVQEDKLSMAQRIRLENTRLVRVRIQNLDPKKKDLPGEILTVANDYMGTVRKFVPYGEATDNGYHIPYCLYKLLKSRKFLHVSVKKGRNGKERVEQQWVREFAIEILPQLTEEELKQLGQAQIAAGSLNDD